MQCVKKFLEQLVYNKILSFYIQTPYHAINLDSEKQVYLATVAIVP